MCILYEFYKIGAKISIAKENLFIYIYIYIYIYGIIRQYIDLYKYIINY